MYFLTPNIGWSLNPYYDYLTPNQYGQIYRTMDGGNTWTLMHGNSTTFYRSMGFVDSLHGWIGNLADTTLYYGNRFTTDTIPLYYTTDGGRTLTPIHFGSPHPAGVCGISVATDSVVYAYGRYLGPAVIAKTSNRGTSWTTTGMSAYATGLVDGKFFDKDTGFVTGCNGNNGVILRTFDGGATWQPVYQGTRNDSEIVWKIFFPSRDTGYASIEYVGYKLYNGDTNYRTFFVKTVNGGATWTEMPFKDGYNEEGIGFINDNTGWLGGDDLQLTYKTTDGGLTWAPDSTFGVLTPPYQASFEKTYAINRFRRFGDTLMYASGNTIYRYGKGILGTNELKNLSGYKLANYPNPFKVQTTVEFVLPQTCHNVKLQFFNSTGKLLRVKDMGTQVAGKHDYIYEATDPDGMLYYTFSSDEFTQTRRMMIIR